MLPCLASKYTFINIKTENWERCSKSIDIFLQGLWKYSLLVCLCEENENDRPGQQFLIIILALLKHRKNMMEWRCLPHEQWCVTCNTSNMQIAFMVMEMKLAQIFLKICTFTLQKFLLQCCVYQTTLQPIFLESDCTT
jgi:hypothetical protein